MGIVANYRQISEFEYASFKRSPLKAYQSILETETNVWKRLQDFSDWASAYDNEARTIQGEYSQMGLYDRLHAVDDDPTRLSKQDRDLCEEQSLKLDAVHKKHARPSWHQFSVDKAWQAIHFLLTGEIEGGAHRSRGPYLGDWSWLTRRTIRVEVRFGFSHQSKLEKSPKRCRDFC